MSASTQNFVQFCAARGLTCDADVAGHIHAGLRSAPLHNKRWARWYRDEAARLHTACEQAHALYDAAVGAGEVISPPRATLAQIAAGHSDNPSVQAARRALERREAVKTSLTSELFGNSEEFAAGLGVVVAVARDAR